MFIKYRNVIVIFLLSVALVGCQSRKAEQPDFEPTISENTVQEQETIERLGVESSDYQPVLAKEINQEINQEKIKSDFTWHIKDFSLNITDQELDQFEELGFSILVPGWGVGSAEISEVKKLLPRLSARNLRIILDAGFSSGAMGFKDDGSDPTSQRPIWQKDLVTQWIEELKNYPAVYGWDISNEAGENLPNGDRFRVSLEQLKNISASVRQLDPDHPILIRMHHWEEYYYEDGDFGWDNPFSAGLADIVMLNLYSNYSEDGQKVLLPDMVGSSIENLVNKVLAVDPSVEIWISLASFEQKPMFLKPSQSDLHRDIEAALAAKNIASIGFYCWGDQDDGWYLPKDGSNLLGEITFYLD